MESEDDDTIEFEIEIVSSSSSNSIVSETNLGAKEQATEAAEETEVQKIEELSEQQVNDESTISQDWLETNHEDQDKSIEPSIQSQIEEEGPEYMIEIVTDQQQQQQNCNQAIAENDSSQEIQENCENESEAIPIVESAEAIYESQTLDNNASDLREKETELCNKDENDTTTSCDERVKETEVIELVLELDEPDGTEAPIEEPAEKPVEIVEAPPPISPPIEDDELALVVVEPERVSGELIVDSMEALVIYQHESSSILDKLAPKLDISDAKRIERVEIDIIQAAAIVPESAIVVEETVQPEHLEIIIADEEGEQEPADDLEWEFDNEPDFEQRQVELKKDRDLLENYQLSEELGRGRFGTVFKCCERATGKDLAAKFVHLRRREDHEDVEREIKIMSMLQHRRLLQLYDAYDNYQTKKEMCLITELIEGGELFERIIDYDFDLTEKKAAIFMRQICEGVEYMHSKRIVHLDMKPENILCLSKTGNRIKLIDFGLARQLNSQDNQLRVMFGTPDFAAPEVLAYDIVTLATDMWSVGVICYVLLSGLSPFMGDNDMDTMANVLRSTFDFEDQAFEPISELAKDFISKLLIKEPTKRLSSTECLQHPWLQKGGHQLKASLLDKQQRRESIVALNKLEDVELSPVIDLTGPISLDKKNLKRYVVRRKWHKTVHAIMALGRMGANLKSKLSTVDKQPNEDSPN